MWALTLRKMYRFERRQSTERRSRGLREELPAGIVLGTNEMDFMGSFTIVLYLPVDKDDENPYLRNNYT